MKNFKATIAAGVLMASLLGITGCSNGQETNSSEPAATASASAVATETSNPTTTAAPEAAKTIVFHTDVDEVVAKHIIPNPKTGLEMNSVFPADKANRKDAVVAALSFYDDLLNIQGFQQARSAGSDKALIADYEGTTTHKVNQDFLNDLNADVDANGYLKTSLPTVNLDGSLGTLNGVEYHNNSDIPAVIKVPDMPQAYVELDAKYGTLFTVSGSYDFIQLTKEGPLATARYNFTVSVAPGAYDEATKHQEWIVAGISIKNTGVSLSDAKTGAAL